MQFVNPLTVSHTVLSHIHNDGSRGIRLGSCLVKIWRRISSVVRVTSGLLLYTGEVDEFREGYFHGKEDSVRVGRFV